MRVVKAGHAQGRQRWLCRRCQYQFTRRDDYGTPDEVKQAARVDDAQVKAILGGVRWTTLEENARE